jgi:hypothetical protein
LVTAAADLISPSLRIYNLRSEISSDLYPNSNTYFFDFTPMGCLNLEKLKIFKIQYDDFFTLTDMLNVSDFSSQHKLLKNLIYNTHNFTHENNSEINTENLFFKNAKKVDYKTIGNVDCFWKDFNKNKKSSQAQMQSIKISLSELEFSINNKIKFNPGIEKIQNNQQVANKLPGMLMFLTSNHPDLSWQSQNNPDPYVPPQTHSVRSKSKIPYSIDNGNFALKSLSHVISNPVILLQSGLFMEIDDPDALFFNSKDLTLQVFSNNWENLFLLPEIKISYDTDKRDINLIRKSSEILFKIKLDLLILDKSLFYSQENSRNFENSESLIFSNYTQINQLIDTSKINFSEENEKFKKIKQRLLLNGNGNENINITIFDNLCNLYTLDEKSLISSNDLLSKNNFSAFYITCNISSPNHLLNMNFIRNHLASSLINLEIPGPEKNLNSNIIGAFSINDQDSYLNGGLMESDRVYCMSSFDKLIISKLLLNSEEKNNYTNEEEDEFVINNSSVNIYITLKKIKLLIWEISFSQDFYQFNKRLDNVIDITISFSNDLKVSFSQDEIKNKEKKIVKFPADMVNLIGTSLNIKINGQNKVDSSPNFSDYQCTLFKGHNLNKEVIDKFYDLTGEFKYDDQNKNNPSTNEVINRTGYIIILSILTLFSISLLYYIFKKIRLCRIKNSIFSSGALNYQNISIEKASSGKAGVGVDLSSKNDFSSDL